LTSTPSFQPPPPLLLSRPPTCADFANISTQETRAFLVSANRSITQAVGHPQLLCTIK